MTYDIFGNEFIFIENKFHPEDGFSFNLKILDAINSIRNGYGDCIVRCNIRNDLTRSYSPIDLYDYYLNPFINNIYVILYKDRTVGDNIREDFLNKLEYDDYIEGYFPVINNNDEPLIIDRSAQKCYPFKFIIENSYLENGILRIPNNTFFIGTANKDDSTYTITDKVYDRAIVISFSDRNEPFQVVGKSDPITLSYDYLMELYNHAQKDEDNRLNGADIAKFKTITDQIYDSFDLTFGNRIMNQIELFVPTFVACGGTKEEALDFMLARKVLIKLDGRFEEYVKKGLEELLKLIKKTYGKGNFALSQELIERLLRRF